MFEQLLTLLTNWREPTPTLPSITEVFFAILEGDGMVKGFQCELGFGNGTTKSFQAATLTQCLYDAYVWALMTYSPPSPQPAVL